MISIVAIFRFKSHLENALIHCTLPASDFVFEIQKDTLTTFSLLPRILMGTVLKFKPNCCVCQDWGEFVQLELGSLCF